MYKRESGGWLKHCDFLLLDMICLQIAFLLSFVVLGRWVNPYSHILYRKMALYLEVADVAVAFFIGTFSDVLKKGYYRNFVTTVQHAAIVLGLSVLYLFLSKEGQLYQDFHWPLHLYCTCSLHMRSENCASMKYASRWRTAVRSRYLL